MKSEHGNDGASTNAIPFAERNASIKETAAWAGVSTPTVQRAIADGDLEALKIGNRTIITPAAREKWSKTWTARPARSVA